MKHDWIKISYKEYNYNVRCERCGIVQEIILPVELNIFLAFAKQFVNNHKDCKEIRIDDNLAEAKKER